MKSKSEVIQESDIDALTFELANKAQATKKKPKHYVNNKELQVEYIRYYEMKVASLEMGLAPPPLTAKIGQAVLDIATRRIYSKNFVGYTQSWKEEMVGDAIEACIKYAHNYNPEKYNNPFAYITQIVSHAMANRITKEKTQTYIKYKSFDNAQGFNGSFDENVNEEDLQHMDLTSDMYNDYLKYIHDFEEKNFKKKDKDGEVDAGVTQFLE